MHRFIAGTFAATLILAACTTGTPGGPAGTGPAGTGAPGGDAAAAELCGTGDTSLGAISTDLEAMDQSTDPTELSTRIGTVISTLDDANVDESAQVARDAAVVALQQLQVVVADPAAREAAAGQAAGALRTLEGQICT